jgi:hypothetical protein
MRGTVWLLITRAVPSVQMGPPHVTMRQDIGASVAGGASGSAWLVV